MIGRPRAALLAVLLAVPSCVEPHQQSQWCAQGKLEACGIACDHGDAPACLTGGKALLEAVDAHDAGPRDEDRALAMLSRACDQGVPKACHAAARAHDDGMSLAPLPWLDLACKGGDTSSCRDAAATRLGGDDGAARDAYTLLCRLDAGVVGDALGALGPGEAPLRRDEPACLAAWSALHAAAKLASPACDAGDVRGCEKLGDAIVDGLRDGHAGYSGCVEVIAPGMSPVAGALACERAGRSYARACSLRGLTAPPGSMTLGCPAWLARAPRSSAHLVRASSPDPGATVTVEPGPGASVAVVEAVQRMAPELLRCRGARGHEAETPKGRVRLGFVLDRTGRPAWLITVPMGEWSIDLGCLHMTLDTGLGVAGNGRTYSILYLVFGGPG